MEAYGLGNHKDIDSFVAEKLKRLDAAEADFSALFELMFSEKENLMYEKSEGYRIRQTTYGEAYRDIFRLASTLRRTLALPEGAVKGLPEKLACPGATGQPEQLEALMELLDEQGV